MKGTIKAAVAGSLVGAAIGLSITHVVLPYYEVKSITLVPRIVTITNDKDEREWRVRSWVLRAASGPKASEEEIERRMQEFTTLGGEDSPKAYCLDCMSHRVVNESDVRGAHVRLV